MCLCWRFIYLDHKRAANIGKKKYPNITVYFEFSAMGQLGRDAVQLYYITGYTTTNILTFNFLAKFTPNVG